MRHVVQFSGGIDSWAAAQRVVAAHGRDDVVLLFADTLAEDPDLYRFLHDASKQIGIPITRVVDGRNPWEVFFDVKFLGNSRLAPCSHILKQKVCRDWLEANCDPADTVLYIGIDATAKDRRRGPAITRNWAPWRAEFPMTAEPHLSKDEMRAWARSEGVEPCQMYAEGFSHANCFHPDTRFITDQGIKTFRETCGQNVRVLGRGGGWRDATVRSFGKQKTFELRLRRYGDTKTVVTTAEHLWPVRKAAGRTDYRFRETCALLPGNRIAGMYGHVRYNVVPSTVGIMAGFTFGDGTASTNAGQLQPARAFLCGDKDKQMLRYFAGCRTKQEPGKITVLDLPRAWKSTPSLDESQSYLYGWLAGYFAADGSAAHGGAAISSANRDHLEAVKGVAARIGIATGRIRTYHRCGFGSEPTPLYTLALVMATLREDFFLLDHHRERFVSRADQTPRPADWTVVDVKPTGRVEEVMCATVPDGHIFTLDDNLLTHNCRGACVRAGQRQWKHLLTARPEVYAEAEAVEEEFRRRSGKDVAILARTRGGVKRPLTLRQLREEQETQGDE